MQLKKFFFTTEGNILVLGLLLLFGYFMSIVGVSMFSTDYALKLLVMSVTNFFFGRAAGISYGYTVEFDDGVIIFSNILVEFIMVLIIYPLFILSWNQSLNINFLRKFFMRVEEQRVKYKDFFVKYGKYGLFLFVWFPFWMTGPVVGAIIGFLIKLKHHHTLFIVLGGTSLAIVAWTYFLKEILFLLNHLSSNAPYILLGLFVTIVIVLKVMKRRK